MLLLFGFISGTVERAAEQYYLAGKVESYPSNGIQSYPLVALDVFYPLNGFSSFYPLLNLTRTYPIPNLAKSYPISSSQTYPLDGKTQTYG